MIGRVKAFKMHAPEAQLGLGIGLLLQEEAEILVENETLQQMVAGGKYH